MCEFHILSLMLQDISREDLSEFLRIFPCAATRLDETLIKSILVHEYCHILIFIHFNSS